MDLMADRDRLAASLDGLSVGDAFGEQFFGFSDDVLPRIEKRELPEGPWRWTDDTEMAKGLARVLLVHGEVDQDQLAAEFAHRATSGRGYGHGTREALSRIRRGEPWRHVSESAFSGNGSWGNGAAMRVAPLGAFFSNESLELVRDQAALSAEVTHSHPEGIAGAVAVAVAAALASQRVVSDQPYGTDWMREVNSLVPASETRHAIETAIALPGTETIAGAAGALGNGREVSAPDTVPLCLWICAHHARDYSDTLWATVSALGDRDTTCAIVGGIHGIRSAIPEEWLSRREPLGELD